MKGNNEFEYEFLRDGHGKIDFNNGSYLHHTPTRVIPKYKSKSHFVFGVTTVKLKSGEVVGKWLNPLCYTGKKILLYRDLEAQVGFEINQVKREGAGKTCCDKVVREEGQLCEEDVVSEMKSVSKMTKKKLERSGIVLVKDLRFLDGFEDTLTGISEETKCTHEKNGLIISVLKQLLEQYGDMWEEENWGINIHEEVCEHLFVGKTCP
eukprot:3432641-Ditylum_brightwellii.AAC.1